MDPRFELYATRMLFRKYNLKFNIRTIPYNEGNAENRTQRMENIPSHYTASPYINKPHAIDTFPVESFPSR